MTTYPTPSMIEIVGKDNATTQPRKEAKRAEATRESAHESEHAADPIVPFSTIATAGRIMISIAILAAIGAAVVSLLVLGGSLAILGFGVAFALILFIGMPLILASIGDELESKKH